MVVVSPYCMISCTAWPGPATRRTAPARRGCRTKLGAFAAAIEDAERCIALEPAWSKGYSRKGHVELLKEYGRGKAGSRA
jgi:hypothetical protein